RISRLGHAAFGVSIRKGSNDDLVVRIKLLGTAQPLDGFAKSPRGLQSGRIARIQIGLCHASCHRPTKIKVTAALDRNRLLESRDRGRLEPLRIQCVGAIARYGPLRCDGVEMRAGRVTTSNAIEAGTSNLTKLQRCHRRIRSMIRLTVKAASN